MDSVTIFGTGALGTLFAARLGGLDATGVLMKGPTIRIAGHWPAALAAIRRNGVVVEEGRDELAVKVLTADLSTGEMVPSADVVLVLVKSYQTAAVAPAVAYAVRPGGLVVTLQNGLGNAEVLRSAVAQRASVIQGTTTSAATLLGPGRIRAGGAGVTVLEAPPDPPQRELAAELVRCLEGSGLGSASLVSDIRPLLWRKLLAACSLLPLAAIYRLPNGALVDVPAVRKRLKRAAEETAAVARSLGVAVPDDPVAIVLAIALATASNRASMLQDVERGRPTEIEATVGEVVRLARRAKVQVPELERLLEEAGSAARRYEV